MHALPRPLRWPPIFPLQKGLVLWLPFDERSGAKALDRSGKLNHGMLEGPTWVAGPRGGALSFNGVDTYVSIPDDVSLRLGTGDFAMLAWVKSVVLQTCGLPAFLGKGTWAAEEWMFRLSANKFQFYSDNGNMVVTSPLTYNDNLWHHVVATRLGDVAYLYVDGVEVDSDAGVDDTDLASTKDLLVGSADQDANRWWEGVVRKPHIYNRGLTAAECKRLVESELMLVRH